MSTENAKIDIRGRQAELKLTFQFAQHMMDNFLTSNPPHDLNFEDIQRVAKKAEYKNCITEFGKVLQNITIKFTELLLF